MDVWWGGPTEDKETEREEYATDHHWGKTGFGDGAVRVQDELAGVEFVVAGGGAGISMWYPSLCALERELGETYRMFAVPPKIVPRRSARKGSLV